MHIKAETKRRQKSSDNKSGRITSASASPKKAQTISDSDSDNEFMDIINQTDPASTQTPTSYLCLLTRWDLKFSTP